MSDILSSGIEFNLAFHPVMLLTIYETEQDHSMHNHYYIERRLIDQEGKLSEAAPLKEETLKNIVRTLARNMKTKLYIDGIIDPRVINYSVKSSVESLMWYCRPDKKYLYFTDGVGLTDGYYALPLLIFKVRNGQMSVWAAKDEPLTLETKLFHAPFPNVSAAGVCMGSANIVWRESMSEKELIEEVERKFFNSKFSHKVGKNQVVVGDYNTVMKNLNGHFPEEILLPIKTTLKDAIGQ